MIHLVASKEQQTRGFNPNAKWVADYYPLEPTIYSYSGLYYPPSPYADIILASKAGFNSPATDFLGV